MKPHVPSPAFRPGNTPNRSMFSFYSRPLTELINFRNQLAILHSNANLVHQDISEGLHRLSDLPMHAVKTDRPFLRTCINLLTKLSLSILRIKRFIDRLDTTIQLSQGEYVGDEDLSNKARAELLGGEPREEGHSDLSPQPVKLGHTR